MAVLEVVEYELTEEEKARYAAETLLVKQNLRTMNGWALNVLENNTAAGDLLVVRKNPRFGKQPGAKRYIHAFTDPHNAVQGVKLMALYNEAERLRLDRDLAVLQLIQRDLPEWKRWDAAKRRRYERALALMALEYEGSLAPAKVEALEQVIGSMGFKDSLRRDNPSMVRERLRKAVERFKVRHADASRQTFVIAQRRQALAEYIQYETEAVADLVGLLKQGVWFGDERFDELAAYIRFKPAVLEVNHAFYWRHEPEAPSRLLDALAVFDQLYGALVKPMAILASDSVNGQDGMAKDPEAAIAGYTLLLGGLLELLVLADIGGEYSQLVAALRSETETALKQLAETQFGEAKKTAERYRFLLRYRCYPGEITPSAWYNPVDGVDCDRTPTLDLPPGRRRRTRESLPKDPFEGLREPF